jgi:hypothetical protein
MEGGCDVTWGLIFVVVLMVLLFGIVVPAISSSRNSQRYDRRGYDDRGYDSRRYADRNAAPSWQQEPLQGASCRRMVVLIFLVLFVFAALVVYFSVQAQAGGGLF